MNDNLNTTLCLPVNSISGRVVLGYDPASEWVCYRFDERPVILPAELAADLDGIMSYRRIDAQEVISAEAVARVMSGVALYGMTFTNAGAFAAALQRIDRLGDVVGAVDQRVAA